MKTRTLAGVLVSMACGLAGCARAPVAVAPAAAPTSTQPSGLGAGAKRVAVPRVVAGVAQLELGWPTWIGVVCEDYPAQRHFYRDVLGLEESNVSVSSSWFKFGDKLLELLAKSERPAYARAGVSIGFAVSNVPAARAQLLERGVEPVGEIEGTPGERWAYFRDADGNLFELAELPR